MSTRSFRLRLHQAVAALASVIIATVTFAFFGAREIDNAAGRSRSAQAVLAAYVMLSSDALRLFKQMSDSALLHEPPDIEAEDALIASLRGDFSTVRSLTLDEATKFGHSENEGAELDRLAALEIEFESILAAYRAASDPSEQGHDRQHAAFAGLTGRIDQRFNHLSQEAIAEEKREVAESDARLLSASRIIRSVAAGVAAFSALLIALVLHYLNSALLTSVRSLTAGAEAYSRGDFDYRIPRLATEEFEAIRQRFTQMAAEISASRESMRLSNKWLEKEVAERTAALEQANARLEAGDKARRAFFADVSHELRTPLTVIRGEAEIALRGAEKSPADYRESLARIVKNAGDTARLVDDLLFIARVDAGEPRLDLRDVALGPLLSETVGSFEPIAAARPAVLTYEGAGDVAVIHGDAGRLRQVIGVVLDNAIRYSRPGGEVRVTLSEVDGAALIAVEDDGIGVSECDRERVFERFYRARNARAHAAGSGLGLPVAKAIIEAHGGMMRLSPSPSGGARVEITLPAESNQRAIS